MVHFTLGNLDRTVIGLGVQGRRDGQAGLRGGVLDEAEQDPQAAERVACPIGADLAEQPMFDGIPFRGPAWKMSHGDRDPGFVGEALQFAFPEPRTAAVAAAAVGQDQQPALTGKRGLTVLLPPVADRVDGELGRIGTRSHPDVPAVVGHIVNSVGDGPALGIAGEIVGQHDVRLSAVALPAVLEITDQDRVLRVDADHRRARAHQQTAELLDPAELPIAIRAPPAGWSTAAR